MVKLFTIPFASTGDKTVVPDPTQADGSVSWTQGYGFDYQRKLDGSDPLAKPFPRNQHNQILNDITAAIREIQINGQAEWQAAGAPYPINAMVRYSGVNWKSSIANNSATPGSPGSGWIDTSALQWASISGTPTTLSGYGITDAYTKSETGTLLNGKADKATTLAGYGIVNGLEIGSGGWLGTAPQITGAISSLPTSQLFAGISPGTTDTPFANTVGLHMRFPGGLAAELAVSINDPQASFYYRTLGGSSTGAWRTVWDNGNFNPVSKISGNSCPAAGFASGDKTQPYMAHTDNTIVGLSRRNTAQLTATGFSKNTDTGEIIQWFELVVGNSWTTPSIRAISWPTVFPTAFLNAKFSWRQSSTSYNASTDVNYLNGTVNGCTVTLGQWQTGQDPTLTLVIEARGY